MQRSPPIKRQSSRSPVNEQFTSGRSAGLVNRIQLLRLPSRTKEEGIPLISGLDTVLYGTRPASDAVLICNMKPPQYVWFMISGAICDAILFAMDYAMHFYVPDASVCWAICFTLSVAFRHSSHRYLVFGNYVGGYWHSLLRIYGGYSVTIVLSTVFNVIMTRSFGVRHYVAWIITLLWTGIVNFFILKKFWHFDGGHKTGKQESSPESFVASSADDFGTNVEFAPRTPQEDLRAR